jgi:putative ABC transport system ATP-binding protein
MSLVRIEGAKKDYLLGKTTVAALKEISLVVENGEFLAIAGPSGSGKTTLLNLICGIEKPTAGKVFFEDTELSRFSPDELADIRAQKIGFIFQNFNLLPVLTAIENVEYPLLLTNKLSPAQTRKIAEQALDMVGLTRLACHRPLELSGGQRQRVAIARAIVIKPSMILADEPTANLDHKTGSEILGLMKDINQKQKTTFIFSTHDQKIMDIANRVINLWDGAIMSPR